MKKYIFLLLLINIFLFNCGNNKNKLKAEDVDDHHQFFNDLAHTELTDLELIIKQSDKVVAYNWNGNNENPASTYDYIVNAYGQFDETVGKSFELSKTQIQELNTILTNETNYNEPVAMCFLPHIAFVYYRNNQITGQSNICFLCEGVKSIPKFNGSLSKRGTEKLKKFCKSIGLNIIDDEKQTKH